MTLLVTGNDHILLGDMWVCISAYMLVRRLKNEAMSALVVKNDVQVWCVSAYRKTESSFAKWKN